MTEDKRVKVIIGIPTRGDDISRGMFSFILNILMQKEKYQLCVIMGQSAVSAVLAVEALWEKLYERIGGFDYYMQIDTDVVPPLNALESMMAKDKDIVVAPIWHYDVTSKDIHVNVHTTDLRGRIYCLRSSGEDKIYASSLGLVLMKHKVIETFIKAKEDPIRWSPLLGEYTGDDIHNDNIFFAKANKLGLETWVDWDVKDVVHRQRVDLSTEVLGKFLYHIKETERRAKDECESSGEGTDIRSG